MALENNLGLDFNPDRSKLYILETTGLYDPTVNTGGWNKSGGDPNILRSALGVADTATITITNTLGTDYVFDVKATIAAGGVSQHTIFLLALEAADIGSFADGIYGIIYTIVDAGATYTYSDNFVISNTAMTCISQKLSNFVNAECCNKDSAELQEILTMWGMLKSVQFNSAGGNATQANKILTTLTRYCSC